MDGLIDVLHGWRVTPKLFETIPEEHPDWQAAQLVFFDCPPPPGIDQPIGARKILLHDSLEPLPEELDLAQVADFAVTTSPDGHQRLVAIGFSPQRIAMMPPPVAVGRFRPAPKDPALLDSLGLRDQFVLLQAGIEGLNDALEGLAAARESGLPVKLLILGQPDRPIDPVDDEHVVTLAEVAAEDLPRVLQLGDLYLATTADAPHMLEAMACGKPVVSPHNDRLAELVERGGRLGEHSAAAITELLQSLLGPPVLPRTPPRLCFINHRYGEGFSGGAETHCRILAENCHRFGWPVQVITTTASDTLCWKDDLPPGDELINGVPVKRFRIDPESEQAFSRIHYRIDTNRHAVSQSDQQRWINSGIAENALYDWLAEHHDQFDFFIFLPYMPFVFNQRALVHPGVLSKAVALPCLHDENPARTPVMRQMLESLHALIFNSPGERDLALRQLQIGNANCFTLGVGIDNTHRGNADAFRQKYELSDPFLIYCGRMEHGKNVPLLVDYFNRYKRRRPGPLKLVLIGSGEAPGGPDVVPLGFVSEQDKLDGMAAGLALINPSVSESFSIVIMECWLQQRPVLVHRGCPVTRNHVQFSGGGLCFEDLVQFEAAIDLLLAEPTLANRMGHQGAAYVESRYVDEVLLARFREMLNILRGASEYEKLSLRAITRARQFSPLRTIEAWEAFLLRIGAISR